jgi:hypothetical protein
MKDNRTGLRRELVLALVAAVVVELARVALMLMLGLPPL